MNISEIRNWISFEGVEGSGKTTLICEVKKKLEEKGFTCAVTREPGGVPIAEQIRDIILDNKNTDMDYMTEAMLYAASRRQHLQEKVVPLLEKGVFVIMDRYVDSSVVYQGYARGLGMELVRSLNDFAIDGMLPEITFYIDLDPAIGLERIHQNKRHMNRLDQENLAFHRKVREGYLKIAEQEERIILIDGNREVEEIVDEIFWHIDKRFF